MTGPTRYRLAVVDLDDVGVVVVECDGHHLPLAKVLTDDEKERFGQVPPNDLMPLIEDWPSWLSTLAQAVGRSASLFATESLPIEALRFRPPIARPSKLICIGANYHDHIAEMNIPMAPTYPYSFFKPASTTLRGSGVGVEKPTDVAMMDWEAELAIIIGVRARHVSARDAYGAVAGYANFNDLSARDWLASRPAVGVDWTRHKAYDGFAPMGPYVVPAEFVADPMALPVTLSVNGIVKQNSNTAQMVFGVAEIIAHLSGIMTLEPGDIIATGTPAGCGAGKHPPEFLRRGDEIRIAIGDLGELVTPII